MHQWEKVLAALLTLVLAVGAWSAVPALGETTSNLTPLARDAQWKYWDQGEITDATWKDAGFDDSQWAAGAAPLGFGDDYSETDPSLPVGTVVGFGPDATSKYLTTYFRTTVEVPDLTGYTGLEIYVHVDDGCVVYVNGVEAFCRGIDEGVEIAYDTSAKFKPKEETFTLPVELLTAGENVIAAEVHQDDGESSDLWFELGIVALSEASAAVSEPQVIVPDPAAPLGAVSKVTVTFNGDAYTRKGFTWYTTLASAGSDVQIVEQTDNAPDFTNAMTFEGRYSVSTNSPAEVVHKAEAVGLQPGTAYAFRVGDASLDLWSDAGSFETAAMDGAFTFIDLADSQAKSEEEAALSAGTFAKALKTVTGAAFMTINGDIVDTGLNEQQWDWLFGSAKDTLLNTTLVAAAGNHEEDLNSFYEHLDILEAPYSPTATGAYFSFDYENAHFIFLNTNEDSPEYADLTPAQVQWLKGDVVSAKTTGAQWLIVVIHKGPYSTSNHASDDDIMSEKNGVRTLVAPLLSELGVDLVLQGHDHIYARTKPIVAGAAVEPQTQTEAFGDLEIAYSVNPAGPIYVIPATAGAKTYYKNKDMSVGYYELFDVADENHAAKYGADPNDASRPVRSAVQNFMGITIDGNRLTAVTYEIDQNADPETPAVVDTFGIIKQ